MRAAARDRVSDASPAPRAGKTIFDGEIHITAPQAALSRAVRFALSRTETALAPEMLARRAGVYQLTPTRMITVVHTPRGLTVEGGPNPGTHPLFAESETEFFLKDVAVQITFQLDATAAVTGLVWHQPLGTDISAKKVK